MVPGVTLEQPSHSLDIIQPGVTGALGSNATTEAVAVAAAFQGLSPRPATTSAGFDDPEAFIEEEDLIPRLIGTQVGECIYSEYII